MIYALPTPVPNHNKQSPGIICPNAVLMYYHDKLLKQNNKRRKITKSCSNVSARVRSSLHLDRVTVHRGNGCCTLLRGPIRRRLDQSDPHAERSMLSNHKARKRAVAERDAGRLASCHGFDVCCWKLVHGIEEFLACEHAGFDGNTLAASSIGNQRNRGEESCGVDVGTVDGTVRRREAQAGHDRELYLHAERDDYARLTNDVQLPGRSCSRLGTRWGV